MRYPRNARIFRGQLDAAPWAGLFFILVIFFLLKSSLFFVPGVRVSLPQASDVSGITNATTTVMVDLNGVIYHNNQMVDTEVFGQRLATLVKESPEPLTLVIQADSQVEYGRIVNLGTLARSVGIKDVQFATRPKLIATEPAEEK
jgi:biopolymer transport protein ExbD